MFNGLMSFFISILTFFNILIPSTLGVIQDVKPDKEVLEDLQVDPQFNKDSYPYDDKGRIEIIQVAKSSDDRLYIYVYQPRARSHSPCQAINMADDERGTNFKYYILNEISYYGPLYKYELKDYKLPVGNIKNISIASIYEIYHGFSEESSQMTERSWKVGQKWIIIKEGTNWNYIKQDIDVVMIENKFVGLCRYPNGLSGLFASPNTDGWFVAFSTDREIESLINATVVYDSQDVREQQTTTGNYRTISNEQYAVQVDLNDKEIAKTKPNGLFGVSYEWKRIQPVSDFIAKEKLTEETKTAIKDMKWVLRFLETPYKSMNAGTSFTLDHTEVKNVSILRLQFVTKGISYDLGVVDHRTTPDTKPDNIPDTNVDVSKNWFEELVDKLKAQGDDFMKILKVILIIVGLILFAKPIEWIFKGIKSLIDMIFGMFDDDDK